MTIDVKTTDVARPTLTNRQWAALAVGLRGIYLNRSSDMAIATALNEQLAHREAWIMSRTERPEAAERAGKDDADGTGAGEAPDLDDRSDEDHAGVADDDGAEKDGAEEENAFVGGEPAPDQAYECRAIVVTGESGAGKSRQIARILRAARPTRPGQNSMPVISLQVPGPCTLLTMGLALGNKLGYPLGANVKEHLVWDRVREHLALENVDILHLDEMQNIISTANAVEKRKLLNTLRGLLIDERHPVILVLSGLPEVTPFLSGDRQIRRRSGMHALQSLGPQHVGNLAACVRKIAARAGLQVEGDMGGGEGDPLPDHVDGTVPRLIHASGRQFGAAVEMAVAATLRAARPLDRRGNPLPRAEALTRAHFAAEYAARTGNAPFANPFLAQDWHRVDPTLVGITHPGQIPADEPTLPKQRRPKPKKPKGESR